MKDVSPIIKVSGGTWSPMNSGGDYGKGTTMTIRQAMARSVNSITGQLMVALGYQNVVDYAHNVGITSKLEPVPSLCLGVNDVTLYEMVGAYGTFVNSGVHTQPIYITRIEDRYGNVIENFVPKRREALSEQDAFKMVYMLQGGVQERGGTSGLLPHDLIVNNELGGKTGTTNDASDGWYMGVTHDLVTGVWVGGDERGIHFPSWGLGSGAVSALPMWGIYMTKVYADPTTGITRGSFKRPSNGLDITLDCSRYKIESDSTATNENAFDIRGN
jgi:penicillin-binding protein 1A